jgi:hypothetical protein
MKKLIILILLLVALTWGRAFAQLKYYEESFNGGSTVGGYSPTSTSGGTGAFTLNIAAGSTIRKAFLIAGRHGNAADITVTLNTVNYTFNSTNQASVTFQSPSYGGNSGVHIIDITADIIASVNSYSLVVPSQTGPNNRYNDYALYVAYNNASMALVNATVFINTLDFDTVMNYTLNFINPINISSPVGLSVMAGYICDNSLDGEEVNVNSYLLGTIGNHDVNSGICGGPLGSYYYSNNTLNGLSDDSQNLAMTSADALSDVSTKIAGNATSITMQFSSVSFGNKTNAVWAIFVSYSSVSSLPVELIHFSGRADGNVNRLEWTTASEINCDYFDIEESNDVNNFVTCGSVEGAGNSIIIHNYFFTDEHPFPGITYYRLKQMDYDGQHEYSNVIAVSNINYTTSTVDVYNLQGQIIMSVKDFNSNYSLKNLIPGVYLLHYHTTNGLLIKKITRLPEE